MEQIEDVDAIGVSSEERTVDPLFVSKDGIVWNPQPVHDRAGRLRNENVINLRPGTTRYARARIDDIKDAFMLFFPPTIENIVLKWSNAYAKEQYDDNYIEINSNLLHAYIGVLILAGVYRSKNETMLDLFDGEYGRPIFRAIMSKKTFQYMNHIIRFDDVMSRRQKSSTDKFAPIREIFDKWSELLADYFNPSECVTIDEQLLGFRGRCKFRQYMPSKPEQYGIKFWLLVCSKTCYVWKIQPYLGKPVGGLAEKNQGQRVVLDLVRGLKG
ncbi:piggyBac transposable element-derived protein 4-like [Anastrepha ludens]|uniref:piggyBac transposable element-derived protein 4-like n=1 Tax=Anastrepha ludens TaxID=28586 RepID=UPI0023B0751B|nr:piggyBac transposable element-derived protein 4-like [Anastrepha ludens]